MHFSLSLEIARPREQVFAYLADPRRRPEWQSSLSSIDLLTEGEPRVGMKWREKPAGAPRLDMEIVEYAPCERWAERFQAQQAEGIVSLAFASIANSAVGTCVDLEVDIQLQGAWRVLDPLLSLVLRHAMRKDLERVEGLLPAQDSLTPSGT